MSDSLVFQRTRQNRAGTRPKGEDTGDQQLAETELKASELGMGGGVIT